MLIKPVLDAPIPSATQNNGKLTSQTDVISGEQALYTYDSLNRLATAQTAANANVTQWGQSYTYDGFGNLTDQNVILGSAPTMHVVYNAATNRQTGDGADANGNLGTNYVYDWANRLVQPGTAGSIIPRYAYDAGGRRVWRGSGSPAMDEITFWAGSQKLGAYQLSVSGPAINFALTGTNAYFAGRLIAKGTVNLGGANDKINLLSVKTDMLGSIGKFYPFGQEKPSATANDTEKFTGYYRDAATGLDYANARYHQPGVGRFMTPDPYGGSANAANPGSLNRYAYVEGDPVNGTDPTGLIGYIGCTNLGCFTPPGVCTGWACVYIVGPPGSDDRECWVTDLVGPCVDPNRTPPDTPTGGGSPTTPTVVGPGGFDGSIYPTPCNDCMPATTCDFACRVSASMPCTDIACYMHYVDSGSKTPKTSTPPILPKPTSPISVIGTAIEAMAKVMLKRVAASPTVVSGFLPFVGPALGGTIQGAYVPGSGWCLGGGVGAGWGRSISITNFGVLGTGSLSNAPSIIKGWSTSATAQVNPVVGYTVNQSAGNGAIGSWSMGSVGFSVSFGYSGCSY